MNMTIGSVERQRPRKGGWQGSDAAFEGKGLTTSFLVMLV